MYAYTAALYCTTFRSAQAVAKKKSASKKPARQTLMLIHSRSCHDDTTIRFRQVMFCSVFVNYAGFVDDSNVYPQGPDGHTMDGHGHTYLAGNAGPSVKLKPLVAIKITICLHDMSIFIPL